MTARLWLVRHGQTDWNLAGRFQGHADSMLNDRGLEQARALALRLSGQPLAALYSSDLARARQTAVQVAEDVGLTLRLDPRLREVHHGAWDGLLRQEIEARYPDHWRERRKAPHLFRPPGGETVLELASRVHAALDDIATAHAGGEVLVVSHGVALASALCRIQGQPLSVVLELVPPNAVPLCVLWPPSGEGGAVPLA